jgi:C1A family cysteine protease
MMHYKFGWLPDLPDERDIPFRSVFRLPLALPESVDLRAGCSPVEEQGSLGSCTAQALVGALEFLEIKARLRQEASPGTAGSPYRDLSRLFVYYNERDAENNIDRDSGATLRTGIKVLKKMGVCRESLWPYEIRRFTERPPPACYTVAADHQIVAYQRLSSLAEMKACLAMGLPFVFGFKVFQSALTDMVKASGDVPMPTFWERIIGARGGHAIMAVGYDESVKGVLFRNSWGTGWGRSGYGWLPYAYLKSRALSNDFWCIQSTESDLYATYRREETEATV